jgi:hypothetical protein
MKKETIVVWFSCGAASAVAAWLIFIKYGKTHNVIIVNNPVDEEDEDNQRFLQDVEKWIGCKIIQQRNSELKTDSAVEIWNDRKYMAGNSGAPCTMLLKKGARYEFERNNQVDWHVLGFTIDEKSRHERFTKFERSNVIPVLIDAQLTKTDCFQIIEDAGIKLPLVYRQGYPNANCVGCVKASGITYWNHVRKVHPKIFEDRAIQSREIGAKLVRLKGKRIFLDELPIDAKGNKMKGYECGIFCDTK